MEIADQPLQHDSYESPEFESYAEVSILAGKCTPAAVSLASLALLGSIPNTEMEHKVLDRYLHAYPWTF